MFIGKKYSGPSFSPAFSASAQQPRRGGGQGKGASPERHSDDEMARNGTVTMRWPETKLGPGSDLQLIAHLASWKPKSKFA